MDNQGMDESLRTYTGGEITLVDALEGYAVSIRRTCAVLGVELASMTWDRNAEPARLNLRLSAAPELYVG